MQELFLIIDPFNYHILGSVETSGIYLEIHFLNPFVSLLLYIFFCSELCKQLKIVSIIHRQNSVTLSHFSLWMVHYS